MTHELPCARRREELHWVVFFFFKQKTAYEIDCDWSSDVCSSDLMAINNGPVYPYDPEKAKALLKEAGVAEGTEVTSIRSEEHTSELQSQSNLVCRLLLEKKKNKRTQRRQ